MTRGGWSAVGDDTQDCIAKANAVSQPMQDLIMDLSLNWRPTGFYSPAQVEEILRQLYVIRDRAYAELERPIYQGADVIFEAKSQLNRLGGEMLVYVNKVKDAKAAGITQIDAPGLRGLVLRVMMGCRDGITTAVTIRCMEPTVLIAVAKFQAFFRAAYDAIRRILGIIYDALKAVLAVPDQIAGAIDKIIKISLVAGLAMLAWWAFKPTAARGANER